MHTESVHTWRLHPGRDHSWINGLVDLVFAGDSPWLQLLTNLMATKQAEMT